MGGSFKGTASDIRKVAVIGAGTMGHGIAQIAGQAGYQVVLSDVDAERITAALARIGENLAKGVARGKVSEEARDQTLARISGEVELRKAATGADLVIEAVPEVLELKRELFATVAGVASESALLASNTSSLSVAAIADAVPDPSRVVGMHFFNPVHIMKLVEVVQHDGSADGAVACARGVAERMGKTAITVRDVPGFASSRLGLVLGLEAMRMVEQGVASPEDIDTAMKLGYGHPMGPLELTDHVGLDIRLHIADYLVDKIGDGFKAPQILRDKVAAGELGKKSGAGFYRWKDGRRVF